MLAKRPALDDTYARYHSFSTLFSIQNLMSVLETRAQTILKLMHQFWQPLLCGLAVIVILQKNDLWQSESGRGS